MNNFNILGKIQRVNISKTQKNAFVTILVKPNKDTAEFITVTSFNPLFVAKYLRKDKWIACTGHIHINKFDDKYTTELIVDNFYFVGTPSDFDRELNEIYNNNNYQPLDTSDSANFDPESIFKPNTEFDPK